MDEPINETDEFLLSRLLDDDLPADEAAALGRRMARAPALRRRFESLARVDAAVKRRHADEPEVDWRRFREGVISAIEAEAVGPPATAGWAPWVRIGVPLAAAAAVALLVSFYPSGSETSGPGADSGRRPMAAKTTSGDDAGRLVVHFHRPPSTRPRQTALTRVTFARSARLAEAIQREDEADRGRPWSVMAAVSPPSLPDGLLRAFIEAPPL